MVESILDKGSILCPECKSQVYSHTCFSCGLVLNELVLVHQTKRCYNKSDIKNRVHHEIPYNFVSNNIKLSTKFNPNESNKENSLFFKRIHKYHSYCSDIREKNYHLLICNYCKKLNLPDIIIQDTKYIQKKLREKSNLVGYSKEQQLLSIIYYCARKHKIPITFDEINSKLNISKSKGTLLEFLKKMNIILNIRTDNVDIKKLLVKTSNILNLPIEIQKKCIEFISKIIPMQLSGKKPIIFIGAIIFHVCKNTEYEFTKKKLSEIINISVVSLRSRLYELGLSER